MDTYNRPRPTCGGLYGLLLGWVLTHLLGLDVSQGRLVAQDRKLMSLNAIRNCTLMGLGRGFG